MHRTITAPLAGTALILSGAMADAHVDIASGPGFANTTQEVVFGIGHGCEGLDTVSLKVEIPAGITSVRALASDFGAATFDKDGAGTVTAVTWQKPVEKVLESDTAYYKLTLRIKVPNQAFTTLYFKAHQTCRGLDAGTKTVDWIETNGGSTGEPAPVLLVLPARRAGWNKFTVPQAISDLNVYFGDAMIVWKDNAAFSANPSIAEMIGKTTGVTPLTSLAANDEIWVRY